MAREKDQWGDLWGQVARDLRAQCGGKWPNVVAEIDRIDSTVLAKMFPGQLPGKRKTALAGQMSNWGLRGTAPNIVVVSALTQLLREKLPDESYQVDGGGSVTGDTILDRRMRESPQGSVSPDGRSFAGEGDRTILALKSEDPADRETAVQLLLEEPEARFESQMERRLGSLLAHHAVRNGLTVEDSREWLSLAELLTVPYARSWPSERLASMLAQLCLFAAKELVNPGVVADRIIAAAALDDRLGDVLELAKQVISTSETPRPAVQVDFVHTFGDGADYLHDGVSLRRFVDWLTTTGETQHV